MTNIFLLEFGILFIATLKTQNVLSGRSVSLNEEIITTTDG